MMAFTLGFHMVLVPFGVAFTFITLIANYRGLRLADADALVLARRWSQVAAVLFAVGAVSGTVLSFEMGHSAVSDGQCYRNPADDRAPVLPADIGISASSGGRLGGDRRG